MNCDTLYSTMMKLTNMYHYLKDLNPEETLLMPEDLTPTFKKSGTFEQILEGASPIPQETLDLTPSQAFIRTYKF